MGLASPLPLLPYCHQPCQCSVALTLLGPWIPVCSGKPGSGAWPLVPQPGRWCLSLLGREQPPPCSPGRSLLTQCCHGSDVVCSALALISLVRICLLHALMGSGAQSLKSWGCLAVFLFRGLHLPHSRSFIDFVWEEGMMRGREGRPAHILPQPAPGAGVLLSTK